MMTLCRFSLLVGLVLLISACQSRPLTEACYTPPESGQCEAAIERYYFDPSWGECRAFIWGGCDGAVPFETEAECIEQCQVPAQTIE